MGSEKDSLGDLPLLLAGGVLVVGLGVAEGGITRKVVERGKAQRSCSEQHCRSWSHVKLLWKQVYIYIHYLDMLTASMQSSRFSPYFLWGPFLEGYLNQGHTDKCTKRIQGSNESPSHL